MTARPVCLLFTLALALGAAGPVRAQGAKTKASAPPPTETTQLIQVLQTSVETKDFTSVKDLREALSFLEQKLEAMGKPFPFLINAEAFRAQGNDPEQVPIQARLATGPKRQTVQSILEQLTSQAQATYLLRQGRVEVVPLDYATVENLLATPILASYDQRPLREVLQDLADRTGATIVLDARAGEAAREPISALFRNNATLEDALRVCTEEAGLKFVVLRNSIFVTNATNARAIQQEQDAVPPPRPASAVRGGAA